MVVAMSFREFPTTALQDERSWFTVATIRSVKIQEVVGGWSRVLKAIIRNMFINENSMGKRGISLSLRGQPVMLWVKLGRLMSDNEGLKYGLDLKGHAGLRPCLRCFNVWMKGKAPPGPHVDICCSDSTQFQALGRDALNEYLEVLREAHERVLLRTGTKTRLVELERLLGINCNVNGILFDAQVTAEIDFLSVMTTDWMHGEVSHGALSIEVENFLCAAEEKLAVNWQFWNKVDHFADAAFVFYSPSPPHFL